MNPADEEIRRFELTLHKPWLGWFPNPTVVVNGDAQPTLWGTRNWKVSGAGPSTVNVYLFNRLWKFGQASITVDPSTAGALVYSAPWLPFGSGRFTTKP